MLEALNFTKGAIARRDLVPALTHFDIRNGRITGYNGRIALSSPIQVDLNVQPEAKSFIKAVETCSEEVALHVTPAGKLAVRSGKFKAAINCLNEAFPEIAPEGRDVHIREDFMTALSKLHEFTSDDASRRWANAVLFSGKSAYATNNICVAEFWLGEEFPCEVAIPAQSIAELLRIGETPTRMQITEHSATFHYTGGRWLHTALYDVKWPDIARVLNHPANAVPLPAGLFEAVHSLRPFVDAMSRIYFLPNMVSTHPNPDLGANIELALPQGIAGVYHVDHLLLLEGVADTIDFSRHPQPALFFGKGLRGALIGMRE